MVSAKLLVKYGFIKEEKKNNYELDKKTKTWIPKEGYSLNKKDADQEYAELAADKYTETGYPRPIHRYHLVYEIPDLSLEEPYYWVLGEFKENFHRTTKVEDSFAASENSAFFGVTQQRLGLQQDKISQFLATTGKMVKELFQMVRELRILDERLTYYDEVMGNPKKEIIGEMNKPIYQRDKSAEITLKGIFVDLVQGGGKNPASIYGMARELEFITLPDLFFDAPPFKSKEEMGNHVNKLRENFNENVTRVLVRHLRQFMEWKKRTHQEHANRKVFMLKYLSQHYDIIKMYLAWLKPYLRSVRQLSLKEASRSSPDLISSFEGSLMDIELIGDNNGLDHCLMVTFNYRTRPHMKFTQEGYNRGPVHVGQMQMTVRVFDWKKSQIKFYQRMKEEENFELLGDVSSSVLTSMQGLGDELERYLNEARGIKEDKEKKVIKKSILEKIFGDFINFKKKKVEKASKDDDIFADDKGLSSNQMAFLVPAWGIYKNFKKSHRLITW
jgi:hypothetical protein